MIIQPNNYVEVVVRIVHVVLTVNRVELVVHHGLQMDLDQLTFVQLVEKVVGMLGIKNQIVMIVQLVLNV